MSSGIWSAASGAVGQTHALDVAAENIANATTPGFKADETVFRQTLADAIRSNNATRSLRYAVTRTTTPDFRNGQIEPTGRPLDVAIPDDRSFFMVATPAGERYTRAGNFRLNVSGTLVTADGNPVLGENHRPVQVDPSASDVSIDHQGALVVQGIAGARIGVVTFKNLSGLDKEGQVLFKARAEAGRPEPVELALETRALEQSNANAITGMTSLVNASRQFEMIARVIEVFGEADRKAATEIMKK
jgi:flagellar basal-body rod protein FlgF